MRVRLQIAAIFIAVGLGALTVTLLRDPMALIPHPPYSTFVAVSAFVDYVDAGPAGRPSVRARP